MAKVRDKDHALDEDNKKGSGAKLLFGATGEYNSCEPRTELRVASQKRTVDVMSRGKIRGGIPPCRKSWTPDIQRTVGKGVTPPQPWGDAW